MNLAPPSRVSHVACVLLSSTTLAACGGGSSGETTTGTGESAAVAVDATAFKDCILSDSIDRGVYQEVSQPAQQLQEVADSDGAELFEAGKADDGLVSFYVLDDPAGAETVSTDLQAALDSIAPVLAEQANGPLGATSTQTVGGVVVGLIPFTPKKETELSDETSSDIQSCIDEQASSGA